MSSQPEPKFLNLTNKTLKVGNMFYKIDNITQVSIHTIRPTYTISVLWMLGSFFLGIGLVYVGAAEGIGNMQLIGVVIFLIGIGGIIERVRKKNKYALVLETNAGSKSLVSSSDKDFIEKIVNKIYEVMNHAQPNANYTFNMEDRSVTIGGNVDHGIIGTGDQY